MWQYGVDARFNHHAMKFSFDIASCPGNINLQCELLLGLINLIAWRCIIFIIIIIQLVDEHFFPLHFMYTLVDFSFYFLENSINSNGSYQHKQIAARKKINIFAIASHSTCHQPQQRLSDSQKLLITSKILLIEVDTKNWATEQTNSKSWWERSKKRKW